MCMTAVFVKCKLPLYSRHCWGHHCMCVVYEGICNSAARGVQYFFSRHDNACVEGGVEHLKSSLIPSPHSTAIVTCSLMWFCHFYVTQVCLVLKASAMNDVLSLYLAAVEGNLRYWENFCTSCTEKSVHFPECQGVGGSFIPVYIGKYLEL